MSLRPNILQSILIAVCLVFTVALAFPDQPNYPGPITSFKSEEAVRAIARVYENPDFEFENEGDRGTAETGDSIVLNNTEARTTLNVLLDGLHYMTPAYAAYAGENYDNGLVLCHFPRFLLTFYDAHGRVSHYFSICFECSNVRMRNGTEHPKFQEYMMTIEGIQAFKKLQKQMFFQRGMMSDSLLFN